MKALVIGANGQLGRTLLSKEPGGFDVIGVARDELDISDPDSVESVIKNLEPSVVINAAAYTAVDKAEADEDTARAVNSVAPASIANASEAVGARLIHVSTDFVFSGESSSPYQPTSTPSPLNVYGATKLAGETAVLEHPGNTVVRTAWVYGPDGSNFVITMLRLLADKDEISVVSDQVGSPTSTDSLASVIWEFALDESAAGVFHWTDGGSTSWHGFATAIQETALDIGLLSDKIPIRPIDAADYKSAARRPAYSVLDCSTTCSHFGIEQRPWRDSLRDVLTAINTRRL